MPSRNGRLFLCQKSEGVQYHVTNSNTIGIELRHKYTLAGC